MADVSGKAKAVHTTWRYRHPNWQCDCPGPATISGRLTGRGVLQLKRTRVVGHCSLRSRTSSPAMSFHPIVDRVSRPATNLVPAFQSGHVATLPKRIITMQIDAWIDHWQDRRDQCNAALSRENDFPAVSSLQARQVAFSAWFQTPDLYGAESMLPVANPTDLPSTTPLSGYRTTASLHRYLDRHPSEASL